MNSRCSVPIRQADPSPVRPFASLPHDIAGDARLTPTDLAVLLALLFWARSRAFCWPSDASIGARIGRSEATVQRRLKALEGFNLIRREKSDRNRTGRIIVLCWREEAPPPMRAASVTHEGRREKRIVGEAKNSEPKTPERHESDRLEPPSPIPLKPETFPDRLGCSVRASEAPDLESIGPVAGNASESVLGPLSESKPPGPVRRDPTGGRKPLATTRKGLPKLELTELARLAPSDPILAAELAKRTAPRPEPPREAPRSTPELIQRLREAPHYPPMLAHALTVEWNDQGSYAGFLRIAHECWQGSIDPETLEDAYRQGCKGRNPGAVFWTVIKCSRRGKEGRILRRIRPETLSS